MPQKYEWVCYLNNLNYQQTETVVLQVLEAELLWNNEVIKPLTEQSQRTDVSNNNKVSIWLIWMVKTKLEIQFKKVSVAMTFFLLSQDSRQVQLFGSWRLMLLFYCPCLHNVSFVIKWRHRLQSTQPLCKATKMLNHCAVHDVHIDVQAEAKPAHLIQPGWGWSHSLCSAPALYFFIPSVKWKLRVGLHS